MFSGNLFEEVRHFQNSKLKKVETQITTEDGRHYIESLSDGNRHLTNTGHCQGFVLDMNADVTVARVAPGLILGSQDVAMDLNILKDCGVTHILNVGYGIPNYFETSFVYKNVNILDEESCNICIFFEGCFEFIDDGRNVGCILVHCNAGVSRAPTIVIAYLMNRNSMKFEDAYALVKKVRPSVRPNDGFLQILKQYEKELFDT